MQRPLLQHPKPSRATQRSVLTAPARASSREPCLGLGDPRARASARPAEGASAISVRGLTKTYGSFHALDSVDLDVPEGSVYGFLGPNGAGKTTTLRILTGLAKPTSGSATIFGAPAGSAAARAAVGFLPDVPGFYEWMTAEEFLRFAGGLFGLARGVLDERVRVLLGLAGLGDVDTKIGGFSRGMKQRLGVAQALVNAPRLLMLDEPTSALDPLGRKEVLDMVAALGGRTTVFFSTHILADVERVCDQVAILDRGKVVAQAPIDRAQVALRGAPPRARGDRGDRADRRGAPAPDVGAVGRGGRRDHHHRRSPTSKKPRSPFLPIVAARGSGHPPFRGRGGLARGGLRRPGGGGGAADEGIRQVPRQGVLGDHAGRGGCGSSAAF